MSLVAGTKLGPYEILSPLGAGGMGEVYRAKDTRVDRTVAVKVLPEEFFEDEERRARFGREARTLASLNHPGIAHLYSFEEIPGSSPSSSRHLLVMELVEGESLRQRISEGALPVRKAVDLGAQMARGLAAAHENGIVHRDLKPENIVLTKDGRAKILDFGLAKQRTVTAGEDTKSPTLAKATDAGTLLGTVGYMAPEQVRGQPADARSDIFAFGCVLFEMLTGKRAFKGESAVETMNAILKEESPEPDVGGAKIPPDLDRLVRHCLEKNPAERFQSARDLAFDLESLAGISRDRSPGRGFRPGRPPVGFGGRRRHRRPRCRGGVRSRALEGKAVGRGCSVLRAADVPAGADLQRSTRSGRKDDCLQLGSVRKYAGDLLASLGLSGGEPTRTAARRQSALDLVPGGAGRPHPWAVRRPQPVRGDARADAVGRRRPPGDARRGARGRLDS